MSSHSMREPEFREDQLARQSPSGHGVKCHVSCDMARYGHVVGHRFFGKKQQFLPIASKRLRSRWLGFVFVSGTVVAPTESCELSCFEIA